MSLSLLGAEAPVAQRAAPPGAAGFTRRLLRRPLAIACCAYLLAVLAVAIVAPIALPWVSGQNAGNLLAANQGPSLHHLLGTDALGRDVLERLLVGTRVSVIGVAEALIVPLAAGVPIGLAAGYLGGRVDRLVVWLADLTYSVPAIVIVIIVLAVFPQSMLAGMTAFGVLATPDLMRVVRSATLPVRQELYIEAAEVSGLPTGYILARHVLPRISGVVIVQVSLLAAVALAVQSGLAFLNLLVAVPAPSWGGMVADGTSVLLVHPWLIWPPGMTIAVTMLALSLLGDVARDAATERWSAPPARRPRRARRRDGGRAQPAAAVAPADTLLSVRHLSVVFDRRRAPTPVLDDVSFDVAVGETVGIVGESGCGKTLTAAAILGLLPGTAEVESGQILFGGRDLARLTERQLLAVRGRQIGFVSQEPMVSLDPVFRVGSQLTEAVRQHLRLSRRDARARAIELLARVRLSDPEAVARRYPHELSGGMAQRVAIARALAGTPKLLIADEPTTALDVTVQAEILALLRELSASSGMAVLIVSHDWGVIADVCDRVVVMYAGQVVERGDVVEMFRTPLHPYTRALLSSDPHHSPGADALPTIPGTVPEPGRWPTGCRFEPRCPLRSPACRERPVELIEVEPARHARCIRYDRPAPL